MEQDKSARLQRRILRAIAHLREARLDPLESCAIIFSEMVAAAWPVNEDIWKPSLELMPPELLKLASDYAEAGYRPIDYAVEPATAFPHTNFASEAAYLRAKTEVASVLRRLHQQIGHQLQKCGSPVSTETHFSLPTRLPGDPPLRFWGVEVSKEPCAAEQLAARMARFLEASDQQSRAKFEAFRITPKQFPLFDQKNVERVWVVGREGPRVLFYNHMFDWLQIGWILSNGKVWQVWTDDSLPESLAHWPPGPISTSRVIDRGDFGAGRKLKMVVAAYGHLDNTEATRRLLQHKIDYYIEQADFSDKMRTMDPGIILACDTPPDPDLGEFLEEIRQRVESQRIRFEMLTGAFN